MKYWRRGDSVDSLFTGFTNAQILYAIITHNIHNQLIRIISWLLIKEGSISH